MTTKRTGLNATLALTTSSSTTPELAIENFGSGEIFIPTGSSITTLTYHVAPYTGGTYLPAQDAAGSAVTQTVAATKAYPIPAILFGAACIKIVANAAGNVDVNLKS